jgi:hypothetical protein
MSKSPDRLTRLEVPQYLLETWGFSEFPINCREAFRADITDRSGKLAASQSRYKKQPFFDGSEADHGGVNADEALALDVAALLKGSA